MLTEVKNTIFVLEGQRCANFKKNLPIHRGLLDFQYSGVGGFDNGEGEMQGGGVKAPVGAVAMRNSEKVWIQLGGFQFSLIGVKRFGE